MLITQYYTTIMKHTLLFLVSVFFLQFEGFGQQKFSLKGIQFGFRLYEATAFSGTPYTLSKYLKSRSDYALIEDFPATGVNGSPGQIQVVKQYYLNGIFGGNPETSKFWKRHRLQAGFFVGSKLSTVIMALKQFTAFEEPSDTLYVRERLLFRQHLRFAGINVGLRRHFELFRNFSVLLGADLEGKMSILHHYVRKKEVFTALKDEKYTHTGEALPRFEGKRVWQAQLMIPLGLAYAYEPFVLRVEGFLGAKFNKYHNKIQDIETNGLAFWLGYKF